MGISDNNKEKKRRSKWKKLLSMIFTFMIVFSFCIPAFASDDAQEETYTIVVVDINQPTLLWKWKLGF